MHATFSVLVINYYEMFQTCKIKMFHLPATISLWSQYTILDIQSDTWDNTLVLWSRCFWQMRATQGSGVIQGSKVGQRLARGQGQRSPKVQGQRSPRDQKSKVAYRSTSKVTQRSMSKVTQGQSQRSSMGHPLTPHPLHFPSPWPLGELWPWPLDDASPLGGP